MKSVRPILMGAAAVLAVLLIALAVILNASFQTWLLRRVIARDPDLHLTVGRMSAGFHHVVLRDVRFERAGTVVSLPQIEADLDLADVALHRRFGISNLVAEGWVVTVPPTEHGAAHGSPSLPGSGADVDEPAGPNSAATAASQAFHGVSQMLALPCDVSLGRVKLAGTIQAPSARLAVDVTGGGLAAGHDGAFRFSAHTLLSQDGVQTINVAGELGARMDTPRTFTRVTAQLDATAAGGRLAAPVQLHFDAEMHGITNAEQYTVHMTQAGRELLVLDGQLGAGEVALKGSWKIDLRDADVNPFAFGRQLPEFVLTGTGRFEAAADFRSVHAAGNLDASLDKLERLDPKLADVGAVEVNADVDLARHGELLAVSRFNARFATPATANPAAARPGRENVAIVHALQAFEFNPVTRELLASDGSRDLLGIEFERLPLAWAKPFLGRFMVEGSDVSGEITATPRAGGFTFKTRRPLSIPHLAVSVPDRRLVRNLDISVGIAGDYTPQGWQAEFSGVTARSDAGTVLLLDAKAGQLFGQDSAVKATGLLSVDLATAGFQPALAPVLAVKHGEATVDFTANLGTDSQIQATVNVKNLAGTEPAATPLPAVSAAVRADIAANHRITFNIPVTLQRTGHTSDLTIAGTVDGSNGTTFAGQISSDNLVLEDVKALAAILPAKSAGAAAGAPLAAPWAGLTGSLGLRLKHVVYDGTIEMTDVAGALRLSGGTLNIDDLHAGFGPTGTARIDGRLGFDAAAPRPFSASANLILNDFDPAPWFAALNPRQPPTVEGRFAVDARITARAPTAAAMPGEITGDFSLTSKSGVFRGLAVNVGNLVENSSKLSAWLAAAGDMFTAPFARKDQDEITSRSQAANELARILSNIRYDQLAIVAHRDENTGATVKEFTLISPDLRIGGTGTARAGGGGSVLSEIVDLDLRLGARGRPAELMKYLGILDAKPDDLGYSTCTMPIRVEGPLDRPDTTQLSNRLVALAVKPSGLTEKAVDWINRLRGKSTN